MRVGALLIVMTVALGVRAAEDPAAHDVHETAAAEHHAGASHDAADHPALPEDATWAGALVTAILFMFFAAAFLGFVFNLLGVDVLPKTASTGTGHADPHAHGHGHH